MSRELMDNVREGYDICLRIQDCLNEDYRNDRISYEEWKDRTKDNETKMTFFREQFDIFSTRLEGLKKH